MEQRGYFRVLIGELCFECPLEMRTLSIKNNAVGCAGLNMGCKEVKEVECYGPNTVATDDIVSALKTFWVVNDIECNQNDTYKVKCKK